MKVILIALMLGSCSQVGKTESNNPEETLVMLPNGTLLSCANLGWGTSSVRLENCSRTSTKFMNLENLYCRQGVCWEAK